MAEALIHALDKNGAQPSDSIVVFDVNDDRLKYLNKKYSIMTASTVQEVFDDCDVVFLAVKPQHVNLVADMLKTPPKGLVVSIVAGCTIKKLVNKFQTSNIIRYVFVKTLSLWSINPRILYKTNKTKLRI